ncbi:MAG: glycosyltransferase family 2 protein [Acidobacteria bacterium]|nr:glycosyltransferase family 2 protein [Acidobacteriota bacterium]MDW7983684.1 glycosyltransferase family 2 protein [Acidobacteriota bacterium]
MTSTIDTTIVIPAYNEEKGLAAVLEGIQRIQTDSMEVIVVDDGSKDGTAQVARRYSCRLVAHEVNRGKGAAIRTGIAAAQGKKVIFIDADGTYPIDAIPRMIQILDECDMVLGVRSGGRENIQFINKTGNYLIQVALRFLYGFKAQDPLTGLYGIHKAYLERMQLISTGFDIESEIALKAARMGLNVRTLPIEYRPRLGQTKLRPWRDGYRILRILLAFLLLYNPMVAFILPGLGFFSVGLILAVLLAWGPVWVGPAGFGVHTMMFAFALTLLGLQVLTFGLIIDLYAVTHRLTRPARIAQWVLRPAFRRSLAIVGLGLLGSGVVWGYRLAAHWAATGFGPFTQTAQAASASFIIVLGAQILFSIGVLSVFANEALRRGIR